MCAGWSGRYYHNFARVFHVLSGRGIFSYGLNVYVVVDDFTSSAIRVADIF